MQRAVLMVIDGLRADLVQPKFMPELCKLAARSRFFTRQRSVFPSATRISAASIATGCHPSAHGLAGNAIALDEGQGLVPVSVGSPEFRERWRRATGRTLSRPTLTERLAEMGGASIYSNSSAGAAHMLDPDGHGWLRHRSGSHSPGFQPLLDDEHLDVTYDASGDQETVRRLCTALEVETDKPLHMLWICEPDHSQHALELGSPEHLSVLAGSDRLTAQVAAAVDRRRARGDDLLFIIAADHGHETVDEVVPVTGLLIEAGYKSSANSSDVVLASSGMSGLLYFSAAAQQRAPAVAKWLGEQSWCANVFYDDALDSARVPRGGQLEIAFAMAKRDAPNRFGVRGLGAVAADPFSTADQIGFGQHGGLGPYETNPLLVVDGGGFEPGQSDYASSVVDIAPTLLRHLGGSLSGMDGAPLPRS